METLKTLLLFIICMGIIISIHEFGHLISAKIFGVYVSEYSIGMGPKLFGFKGKETAYNLRALPLGGFCSMAGEDAPESQSEEKFLELPSERLLSGIAKWKRAIIMFAGIFMNFVLALIIFGVIIASNGVYAVSSKPIITEIKEDKPAINSELKVNDLIEKVTFENGTSIKPSNYNELSSFLSTYDGNGSWTFIVDRNGEDKEISVTPIFDEDSQTYLVGIGFSGYQAKETNFFNCWYYAFDYLRSILKVTIVFIFGMFRGVGLDNVSGPVGIYEVIKDTSTLGLSYYFELIGLLSANVGLMNALPLPIFDGGRALLLLIEAVIGRPLNKKVESMIMAISMVLLIFLAIVVTYKDILKLF